MFHIHTLDGEHYDISLESLLHRKGVERLRRRERAEKFIRGEEADRTKSDNGHISSYAEKTYREMSENRNEPVEIFYAHQIMSSPVKTLRPLMKVGEALAFFNDEGVRHMPVIADDGRITGIVSDRDLLKHLLIAKKDNGSQTDESVANVMVKEVITASKNTDIRRIAQLMFYRHIGTMPVLNDEHELVGIITRSDILHALINFPPLKLWG